jgi:threonine/homoserine/homoserine lactone efflux protein
LSNPDAIYLMMTYVFVGLFSPGPNVVLLTASGARFGFRATVPHILGVALGVGIIAGLTGLGIGVLILTVPWLIFGLKIIAALWILWMAWGLWQARPVTKRETGIRPFTFVEAVLFQAVNPKIWIVALAAAIYVAEFPPTQQAMYLAAAFSGINLFVCLFWTWAGTLLSLLLNNPRAWLIFMRIMAVALAGFSLAVFL